MKLYFDYDDSGNWEAPSQMNDQGSPFHWRISVTDEGYFCIAETDTELTSENKCFSFLKEAQDWCQKQEESLCCEAA